MISLELFGFISVILGLIGTLFYFIDIFKGKTKPHFFSWFIWALLTLIAFGIQVSKSAGPGSWINGFTGLTCLAIAVISLFRGEKDIKKIDVVCFILALIAIVFWLLVKNPLLAIIIVVFADALGFAPTFRKAYMKPYEETMSTYILSSTKYLLSLFALQSFTLTTSIFSIYLVAGNGAFVIFALIRKQQIKRK